MAKGTKIHNTLALANCNAIVDAMDADTSPGEVIIYAHGSGTTIIPVTCSETIEVGDTSSDYYALATLVCSATAFGAASEVTGARAAADTITDDSSAVAGTALFYRGTDGAGLPVIQGTCGTTTDFDMSMNTTTIVASATVAISSWYVNVPDTGA